MMPAGPELRLLVVDDDPDDAVLIRKALSMAGAPCAESVVDHVTSVSEAEAHLEHGNYDAVLVDYRLGAADGISLLERARTLGVSTPAIFVTGQGDEAVAVQAMKAGAVDYLQKSKLTPDSLASAIRHASELRKSRALAEAAQHLLRESEERFRRAIVDAPFPIMIHTEDGAVFLASTTWLEVTGYSLGELPTVFAWMDVGAFPVRADTMRRDLEALYALDQKTHHGEWTVTTRGGGKLAWDFSSAPLGRLEDGRRIVMTMAADVTDRPRT